MMNNRTMGIERWLAAAESRIESVLLVLWKVEWVILRAACTRQSRMLRG